jgi:hypothetical protein
VLNGAVADSFFVMRVCFSGGACTSFAAPLTLALSQRERGLEFAAQTVGVAIESTVTVTDKAGCVGRR